MLLIYKWGYYSAIQNEDIMSFAGKWIELENIILSEVTQIQKDKHIMYSLLGKKSTEYLGYNAHNSRRLTS